MNFEFELTSTAGVVFLGCQLGNIANRTGRTLDCDPDTGKIVDDKEAMKLWKREYEPGWEPTV